MSKFEDNLKMAFSESQYDLCMRNQKSDPEYRELQVRCNKLFERLRDQLGKRHRKMLLKWEDMRSDKDGLDDDAIYLQGMIDCVKLLRLLEMF